MATRYHEIALEGPTGRTLGFVQGFLAGRGHAGRALDAWKEGFDCESLRERIRELFQPQMQTYHLLVPADLVPTVHEALRQGDAQDLAITIREERPIEGARFTFEFQVYSREHGPRIRSLFDPPPAGVALSADASFQERVDPDATGVEAYAPAHDYELKGSGTVEGDLSAVLGLHRAVRDDELVEQGPLELIPTRK